MDRITIEKLKKNPHYKPSPGQFIPDEEENIRTFGILPKQNTIIPKHPTGPRTVTHKLI